MVAQLPIHLQKRVLDKLKSNDFVAAKAIHDQWYRSQGLVLWKRGKSDNKQSKASLLLS